MIKGLTASELETMIRQEKEKDFLVVDVRQPEEYRLDHIPGSINIPLAEIQFDPYSFEDDRKLIFCCTRGSRSKVAAIFVLDAGYDENKLYHLENGLFEYSGEVLLEMPRVDLFPDDVRIDTIMETAINFEKGAYRFYTLAKEKITGTKLYSVIDKMARDEMAHGKAIFKQMEKKSGDCGRFDDYFAQCEGRILEGGKQFKDVETFFLNNPSSLCMDILDFAIEIEYSAYDLYKTMAEQSEQEKTRSMFFSLAQAEKVHLEQIIHALDLGV